ncbi:MAG: hypothetical protein ACK4RM_05290 [Flavobacterium sp.]
MKILDRIIPLLILLIVSNIWAIQIFFNEPDGLGWGWLLVLLLNGFATGILIVDLLLKRFIKNWKKVMLIESGIVLSFIGWCLFTKFIA